MLQLDNIFECVPETPCEVVEDEIVILSMDSGYYYSLNELGRFIWEKMDGKSTLDNILQKILDTYEVNKDVAKEDLLEIMNTFLKENLVRICN